MTKRSTPLKATTPRFVSVSFETPAFDPITVFERSGAERTLWLQPSEGFAMVGIGSVDSFEAAGADRFAAVQAHWHEVVSSVERNDAGPGLPSFPIALAAFSFTDEHKHAPRLPDGALVIPRLLFLKASDTYLINIMEPVNAGADDIASWETEVEELLSAEPIAIEFPESVELVQEVSRAEWAAGIEAILAAIGRGEVEKVVHARTIRAIADRPFAIGSVLRALAGRNPRATVFAGGRGDTCFLGATPERLVSLNDGRVQIDCLAGTIKLPEDAGEADALASHILGDSKELHEHEVVARAIREALAPVCQSIDAPSTPSIKRTADVQHLHTPITAVAKDGIELFDLVERLHPTPAMGGYPRGEAMKQIAALESFDRGWYASPVGWVDAAGNGDFAVAIRSALVEGNEARLYAGNGIVEGSDPGREYEETELKLRAMLWALRQQ